MKRRIILILTTLLSLLGGFYLYTQLAGTEHVQETTEPNEIVTPPPLPNPSETSNAAMNVQDVEVIARDQQGRLEGIYRAQRWDRRPDGAQVLTKPHVELYQKNGQQIIFRADKAVIFGEEITRGINVRRAKLTGNVTIYFDPSREPQRLPIEKRLDTVTRVYVDEVDFDNEHLTVTTDKRVTVFSPQADIYGTGLVIRWNESPRELRLLKIVHGEYMAVYNVPEELNVIALPGSEPEAGPASTTSPATAATATPRTSAPATSQATTTPSTAPAKPPARNQYLAEFHDGVKVIHRNRRLSGADVLSLAFDWDSSWRNGSNGLMSPARRKRRAESQPTTQPTTSPAGGVEPMEVYWTGPLIIKPTGRTDAPSRDRFDLSAEGRRVVLTDPRATVVCRRFTYQHPQRSGWLEGGPDLPVRMLLSEGADVSCGRIHFEPDKGKAWLYGAGYMSRRFPDGLSQAKANELIETDETDVKPAGEQIIWGRSVELSFTDEKVRRADGTTTTRPFIHEAQFHQDVSLRQTTDPNGDFLQCDDLTVAMAHGKGSMVYPSSALAVGHVKGRQEGANISAGRVSVDFLPIDDSLASRRGSTRAADSLLSANARFRPATVIAEGGVTLTSRRDPNDDLLTASARRVVSKLIESGSLKRTAVLTGTAAEPAKIQQGSNKLVGIEIQLDQTDDSASVDGGGALAFVTKKDGSGNPLAEPRAINVKWTKKMHFSGQKRTAEFLGDVALDSALDTVRCQDLQLVFTDELPTPGAATTKTTKADRSRLSGMAMSMEKYGRRRIQMIYADKDIVLRSRREDVKNRLVRRMQLTGEKLIYDADAEQITMLGHGTFINEDYSKPRASKITGDDGIMPAVGRPSQSAFEWSKSMRLSQAERMVTLDGGVTMVYRTGDQILLTNKLNVPRDEWGRLPEGRKTILKCGNMIAKFGAPVEGKSTGASTQPSRRSAGDPFRAGPTMGPLDLFSATGDVNLKDGPRQVLAQRLIFNRGKDLAVIWGYLEGKTPADAVISYSQPEAGRVQTVSGPKLIWYRQDNRIYVEDVRGTGGR